jgi:hypothetical protein
MRSSLGRRVGCVERIVAGHRRTHHLWQGTDETDEAVEARIGAKIACGEAGPNDRFITYRWRSPAVTDAEK